MEVWAVFYGIGNSSAYSSSRSESRKVICEANYFWYRVSVSKGAYERLRGQITQNLNLLSKTAS